MSTFKIRKPRPVFRRSLRQAPAQPIDDRVLVKENKPEDESEGGLAVAEASKERAMHGVLFAAGDAAADYFYDRGIELGDTVYYAKYAGVVEQWQHIVGPDNQDCAHDGAWDIVSRPSPTLGMLSDDRAREDADRERKWSAVGGPSDNIDLRECRTCGTLIASERVIAMSCKDVLMSVELQERLESGAMVRYRGVDSDGKTRHYVERKAPRPECFGPVEPPQAVPEKLAPVPSWNQCHQCGQTGYAEAWWQQHATTGNGLPKKKEEG